MSTLKPYVDNTSDALGGSYVTPTIDAEILVYHLDLLIAAMIAFLIVINIPRGIALFGTSTEWCNGWVFRYSEYRRSHPIVQALHEPYPPPPKDGSTDDSHTLYSHSPKARRVNEKGAPIEIVYPPHIAACPRLLRRVLGPLRSRITPTLSMGQAIILAIYFYILVYGAFYKSSPFTDPTRTGWLAVSQLPVIYVFASKNNALGALIGIGYERLNFLHRFGARLIVLSANLHSIFYFYKWSIEGNFMFYIKMPANLWGLVALICFDVLFFFSLAFWRQRAYNLFLSSHIICLTLVLPATYLHRPDTLLYILTAVGFLGLDYLLRLLKTRITTAIVLAVPELDATRVEVPNINAGWRAGQHVRLRILSSGMGWWGWSEIHPFTIASLSRGPEGLVLICKKAGGWTQKLYEIAKTSGYTGEQRGREIKVMIEGPYGGPGHTVFASFSAAVFVVGGSGITFALSAIQDLIHKDIKGQSRVKVIELVWMVQDPAALVPLVPLFNSFIQKSVFTPVRISVFYTRAPIGKFPFPDDFYHPGLSLAPGRPRIGKILDSAICRAVSLGSGVKDSVGITGLIIGVCGPVGIGEDVVKAVGAVESLRRDQVGGIEIHEEVFGW